jgi:hypothetical protein
MLLNECFDDDAIAVADGGAGTMPHGAAMELLFE